MIYHFNEGHITAPQHLADRTLNLLAPKPGEGGLTIAISRDELAANETREQFIERQLAELASQVSQFQRGPIEEARLGKRPKYMLEPGVKFGLSYKQQGKKVHHVQAAFTLPNQREVLSFTFSLPTEFGASHHQMVADVLASFVLRT